ncbi:lytic transglycosylase domain-containing protein [Dysgonomonas sp. 25]|uniref:lytic transglycosylase domain-containing protein n=1 Tax=Dysgonomonas sp. 25 TaxID=2302933 RepID=UPI0013D64B66|nr:lytic transglycosylase domain-containing protein [Dysgonomonas sp. 25]NDV68203.1 LysM peptidoglycan-binding domain-containing protein [Dysgonomonas sp. 25]
MILKKLLLIFISSVIILPLFSQQKKDNLNVNSFDDPSATFPADMERNYDELLLRWKSELVQQDGYDCTNEGKVTFPDEVYIERLYALPSTMELCFNPLVKRYIEMYAGYPKMVSRMLAEGEYYFPLFEEALEKEGLPLELKYLPVIESALNPVARSRVGATGLWQFMLGTGRLYKLEVNSLVDERSDPHKSTEAAVKYMKSLYATYKDWNLVIAAYNCGPGGVNKAIKRADGQTDYWAIYPYLPRETRSYVPIFIAATYIMSYPKEHNICPAKIEMPLLMDSVMVSQNLHLQQVAEVLDIPIEDVRAYNPQYRADIVPGAYKPYAINLPLNKTTLFIEKKDAVFKHRANELLTHRKVAGLDVVAASGQTYKVKKGDTLGGIARKYGVSVASLKKWNGLKSNNISTGRRLYVSNPVVTVSKKKEEKKPEPEVLATTDSLQLTEPELSTLDFGTDYLADIMSDYALQIEPTSLSDFPRISLDNSDDENTLERSIEDAADNIIYHKVKIGETLTMIASRYNVSNEDIIRWNKLNSKSARVGNRLIIHLPQQ